MADTTPSKDLIAAITSSRDAYFAHRPHLQRTEAADRLFAEAFVLGADSVLDTGGKPAAWMDDGTHVRDGSAGMMTRVVTAATKATMHAKTAAAYTIPLYTAPQPNAALADGWMPIETAPKDGAELWVFNGEQGVMHWTEGNMPGVGYWFLWVWADQTLADIDPEPVQPTHWRRLPAPPTLNASKEQQL